VLHLRFHLWLIFTLLISPWPLIQAQGVATTAPGAREDEAEVRGIVDEYFNALRDKDWERLEAIEAKRVVEFIVNGSDSHGPLLPYNTSLELTKRLLTPCKIEILSFTIDRLEINGREAAVHVRVSMRVFEPNTGARVIDFVNVERVLYLNKDQAAWELNMDGLDGAALEEQIKKARTSTERQFLFSRENLSELAQAVEGLKREGVSLLERESLDQALNVFGLAQEIDDHIRKRATVGAELRSKQRAAGIAAGRASGQLKELALNLLWAGQDYAELKDYAKAAASLSESIKLLVQLGDRQELAKAHDNLADVYLEQGRYSQAVESYQDSINEYILAAAEGKEDRDFAIDRIDDEVIQVAALYSAQGRYDLAEKFVLINSEKIEKLGGAEDAKLLLYVIAMFKMARGDSSQAAEDMEKILLGIDQLSHEIEDKNEVVAGIRLMLTMLYSQQSNFAAAAQQFEKMRQLKVKIENEDDDLAWDKLLQFMDGVVYGGQGNEGLMFSRFKKVFPEMMQTSLEELSAQDVLQVSCMGRFFQSAFEGELPQKDFDLALRCFQFSATMSEKSGDKIPAARAHQFIAALYANKKNYSKEIEHCLKGVSLLEGASLSFTERYATRATIDNLLLNAGAAYDSLGNYEEAITTYQKILDRNNLRLYRFFEQLVLLGIAESYYKLGKFTETINYAAEAVRAAKSNGDREISKDAYVLAGHAHWALNHIDSARKSYHAAIDQVEAVRPQVAGSEHSAARFFQEQLTPYAVMVEFLLSQGRKEDALSYSERGKSKVLLDILKNGRKSTALSMTESEQRQEYDLRRNLMLLNRQVIRVQASQVAGPERTRLRNRRVEARLDYELFRARLYVNHPELAEHPDYEQQTIRPEEIGQLLTSPSDAILEFMVTEEATYLFVLTKQIGSAARRGVDCEVYRLGIKQDELQGLINNFRLRVSSPEGVVGQRARELYELLLGPARERLADKKLLIIVPDGILWNLPFQALKPTKDRYLLEECAIYYAPSLTALREMQRLREGMSPPEGEPDAVGPGESPVPSRARPPSLLAVGNPSVCENRDCNRPPYQFGNFGPLPGAERLAQKLSGLYGLTRSGLYPGKMADEATVKREAARYRVIHIGAHGVLDNDNPMYSFLLLSQSVMGAEDAGAGGGEIGVQDGFLEAWELMDLQLKAEMIVLSSCDTARGEALKGEGIVGFSWAALVAGCPTVVVGQWQVDESATSELMYGFHQRWRAERVTSQTHVNVASALQRSELALLRSKKYSHPYYWAGFTIVGVGH
jgi:CHAT domain-containing protein